MEVVYFIRYKGSAFRDYIKIGRTKNLKKRVKQLQTASPTGVEVIASYPSSFAAKIERQLHRKLSRHKSNPDYEQSEWFLLRREDLVDALFLVEEMLVEETKYKKKRPKN